MLPIPYTLDDVVAAMKTTFRGHRWTHEELTEDQVHDVSMLIGGLLRKGFKGQVRLNLDGGKSRIRSGELVTREKLSSKPLTSLTNGASME